MKKISKKIVALATMAAFVLTLVPAAAFAAPDRSAVTVAKDSAEVSFVNGEATADVTLDVAGIDVGDYNYVVWLEDSHGDKYYYAEPSGDEVTANNDAWPGAALIVNQYPEEATTYNVKFKLDEAGTYTVHAAVDTTKVAKDYDNLTRTIRATAGQNTITVNEATSTVKSIATDKNEYEYVGKPDGVTSIVDVTATVKGQYDGSSKTDDVLPGKEVTVGLPSGFSAVSDDAIVDKPLVTDKNGQVSFKLYADKNVVAGPYTVSLISEGVTKNIIVNIGTKDTVAKTVEAVDTGKDIVATGTKDLARVAQVVFKNAAGEAVSVADGDTDTRIMVAPDTYKGDFNVVAVGGDSANYKLVADKTLTAGKYTVRVALTNRDSVDITFTVENFGKVVDSKVVLTKGGVEVSDVYEGETYNGEIVVVDENGIEQPVANTTDLTVGFLKGTDAATLYTRGTAANGKFTLTVNKDKDNPNKYVGTDITVMAFAPNASVNAKTTVTVADAANLEGVELDFDSEAGEAAQWNKVGVSLVNANGDAVTNVNATGKNAVATVVSKSNEDANVQVQMGDVTKGKATLKVYSDKETTADILVVVRDTKNNKYAMYANTLTYAFGKQDIPVDTTVVMTIGSSDFVVNDKVVTKEDSAPYVANDRTYVPFRALGEALGAEVVWDNDARTVTYTLGKTEVVMTIGEKTYTINDEEKTMDVAPVITGDRTYVPVRFVGEALGFNVTALANTDGTTASVVFQK